MCLTILNNEDTHNLYTLSSIIRVRIRWVGLVACMRKMRKAYNILVAKPVRKRPLVRPRRRWEDNIRMDLRVFENRVLRRIFGPKREEDGSWRKLHNDELHNLYSSPNIVTVIKSRRMRWAGHVARVG
jgi:hypothetical protein